jgi:Uma2 family endonuclease
MVAEIRRLTAEEFEAFALQPANKDKRLELIAGEIIEVVSNQEASWLALRIGYFISSYLDQHPIGYATGADGGYQVGDNRCIPDVGYISKSRQPKRTKVAYNPQPPDLAVEVISPSDTMRDILAKVANYLAAGTVVWVFFYDTTEAQVYVPGQPVRMLSIEDTLDGGDILPGFTLPLKKVFDEGS